MATGAMPAAKVRISLFLIWSCMSASVCSVAIDQRYAVNQRPASRDFSERSQLESRNLQRRQAIPSCENAEGGSVELQRMVAESVDAGLPYASEAGVVFMEAVVGSTDACGPYACYVSSDATGTSWANMIMLQNVPAVADRCSVTQGSNEYTLVASFPSGIECTGEGGACLVMCKAPNMPSGNCAAVGWSPGDTSDLSSSSPVTDHAAPTTVISTLDVTSTQTQTSTYTTSHREDRQPTSSSVPMVTLPSSAGLANVPTLRGFSGENGPGGPSEQHINFGLSITSDTLNATSTGSTSPTVVRQLAGSLLVSSVLAYTLS